MHLLIGEDDPIVADVLGMALKEAGHFKITANTIETALSELKYSRVGAKQACQQPANHGKNSSDDFWCLLTIPQALD